MTALLKRKKASLCIGLCICTVSVCIIAAGGELSGRGLSYSVRVRHYGIDAEEMERTITIPLEDALFSIPGVRMVRSSTENSGSRVFIGFSRPGRGQYEAIREAVQGVYETFPSSVQRPEIFGSDDSRIPVWSAAVSEKKLLPPGLSGTADKTAPAFDGAAAGTELDTAFLLERYVKPGLKGLEGVGEVLVSGTGLKEIIIAPDQDKLAALGIETSVLSAVLETNDSLFPGGYITHRDREIIITVDGRYASNSGTSHELSEAFIPAGPGKALPLSGIAGIYERERPPDTLARLNGKRAAVISVMEASGADLKKLSREIKQKLAALSLPLEFTVLSDRGAEEAEAFKSVLSAALQGSLMVSLMVFLMNRGSRFRIKKAGLICSLSVPAACLVSTAFLLVRGVPPDRSVLAGLSVGVGTAADAVILCAEELRRCRSYAEAGNALAGLRGPLISGSVTTIAALLPLMLTDFGGSAIIARAIAAITLSALVLSLTLLPPLLLWDMEDSDSRVQRSFSLPRPLRRAARYAHRFLAADVRLCIRKNTQILIAGFLFSALGAVMLFIRGADAGQTASEYSVYARVEFEGGFLAEEGDLLLAAFSEAIAGKPGIKNVQTEAGTSGGSMLILFDPARTNTDKVRELARSIDIAGGFLFFPETTPGERHWEIKIFGDDDKKCRELAEKTAALCAGLPDARERILNFKEGSKRIILTPDREQLAKAGISFSALADSVRRGVHGPVAYKRIDSGGEMDVRIRTAGVERRNGAAAENSDTRTTGAEIPGLLVSAGNVRNDNGPGDDGNKNRALRIESLVKSREEREPSSIRREDRRRMASITIVTGNRDPRRVKKDLIPVLEKLKLPPGYTVEFDPEAIKRAEGLGKIYLSFLLALVFCYMVIASVNESFTIPFAILSTVPPSLALPALFIAFSGSPINSAAACAFVAVSGMAVNAAVLCAGGLTGGRVLAADGGQEAGSDPAAVLTGPGMYRVLRRKIPALLATSVTTITGALPFLLLREEANALVRTLSLVTALGVGGSCFCSLCILPAFFLFMKKITTPAYSGKEIPLERKGKTDLGCIL